jgi:serine protease
MRKTALTATVVAIGAAIAMPLGASADHKPGHNPGGDGGNPELTISATPNPVLWANAVTITGRLRGPDNGGKTVELQSNPFPYPGPYETLASKTTDAQGDYSFQAVPARYTDYRVVARTSPDVTSGEVRARVRMRINRRVSDTTPDVGQVVTFTGRVAPAHDGRTVYVQRRNARGVWRTKASATLVDSGDAKPANSAYSAELRVNRDGVYRVLIRRDEDHLGNKTRRVRLDVP